MRSVGCAHMVFIVTGKLGIGMNATIKMIMVGGVLDMMQLRNAGCGLRPQCHSMECQNPQNGNWYGVGLPIGHAVRQLCDMQVRGYAARRFIRL